jgi:IS4 transposase
MSWASSNEPEDTSSDECSHEWRMKKGQGLGAKDVEEESDEVVDETENEKKVKKKKEKAKERVKGLGAKDVEEESYEVVDETENEKKVKKKKEKAKERVKKSREAEKGQSFVCLVAPPTCGMMYASRTSLVVYLNCDHKLEKAATVQQIRHVFPRAGNIHYKKGSRLARYPDP